MVLHRWTDAERARLAEIAPGRSHAEIRAIMTEEFGDHFGGKRISAALKRYGILTGLTGRFEKGSVPYNKGKTWADYGTPEGHARSRATQFKAGEVHGYAAQREQPVGSERVNRDGYVEVKVADGLQARPNCNFRMKHHVVYEQAHGAIPEGCNVVFADHDKRNFNPDNLVAVPREIWAVISHRHYDYWDAESLRLAMRIAEVDRARHAAQRRPRARKRCGESFAPRFAAQRTCDACLGR